MAASDWNLDRFAGRAGGRRALVFLMVALTTALGATLMATIISARGPEFLKAIFLPAFVLVFAWISLSFWSGVLGFVLGVLRLHPLSLRRTGPADGPVPELTSRTAILIPIYNEDTADVFARLTTIHRSLEGTGRHRSFHFFVLSDT